MNPSIWSLLRHLKVRVWKSADGPSSPSDFGLEGGTPCCFNPLHVEMIQFDYCRSTVVFLKIGSQNTTNYTNWCLPFLQTLPFFCCHLRSLWPSLALWPTPKRPRRQPARRGLLAASPKHPQSLRSLGIIGIYVYLPSANPPGNKASLRDHGG